MNRITIGLAAGVLLALTSLPVSAATRNWLGGSATWDDTTTANWSGGAVPVNGDTANITSNTAANLSVGYTATGLSALGTLTVSNPGSGTNTLYLDGSDSLTVTNLNVNARGALNLSGGTLAIPAGGIAYVNGGALAQSGGLLAVNSSGNGPIFYGGGTGSMSGGAANTRSITVGGISGRATFTLDAGTINDYWVTYIKEGGTFNQNGGCFTQMVNYMYLNAGSAGGESNSVFNMRGGTNCPKYLLMGGAGVMTFNQSGGVVTNVTGGIEMRDTGPMTYNLSGGFAYIPSLVSVGSYANSRAAFNHTGGTLSCNQLLIGMATGNYDCTYTLNGGTLNINVPNNAQAKVYPHGIFQGYGTVTMINYQFQNDGRVIADGCGNNTNLDLSTAGTILNATDNTTNHGWFAVNKGRLVLPSVAISAGASTQNWGEAAADTTIDLVNSARLTLTGATAGSLTGALYSVDRSDVPAGLYKPVGVWSFGGVACSASTVTFRYDDAAAAALGAVEGNLLVWRHNGTAWVDVTSTRDTTAKTITSLPFGSLATTAFFAVAPAQPAVESPVIQNGAVSNVTANGATFNGTLVTNGSVAALVYVVWGENNGVTSGSWANTNLWNPGDWTNNSYPSTNISLSVGRNYYYSFGASNTATNVVASLPQSLITGELTVQATDPTGRVNAVDTAAFTVSRPATCTNENVYVNYVLGGTATNVTDYSIAPVSGAVVIAQGQTSGTIVVSPVYKPDVEKTVVLTLTAGSYAIGAANSATCTLKAVVLTVPTTRTWVGGSGTWDETTTNNWNPADVPHNGDTINITSNAAAGLSVGYTAANLVGTGLVALTISNPAGATNTLNLDGSDFLPTAALTLNPGGAIYQTGGTLSITNSATISGGTFFQNGGLMSLNSSAGSGPAITGGGTWIVSNGVATTRNLVIGNPGPATLTLENGTINDYWIAWIYAGGVFNQNGGTFNEQANYVAIGGSNSVLNMRGGTNSPKMIIMNGVGIITINQSGGVITNASLDMRDTGAMTYNLSGGSVYFSSANIGSYANSSATFNHTGGALWCNQLYISNAGGNYDCTYTLNGGTLNINVPNNAQAKVYPHGIFQGYGTVTMINYQFQNDGRVIADGCGNNTNLDLSTAGTILNATDNTTNHGWFAVNKGKLLLPNVAIAAGASTQNWGEAAADTTIDLVNSARLAFSGATAGNLTGNLLASDRTDVPSGLRKPVGIWSFGGVTCTAATVTFRYDDAAAAALRVAESDLRVWRYSGTTWMNVTDTRDDAAKTIASLPVGSLGTPTFFAVAPSPFPGTVFAVR